VIGAQSTNEEAFALKRLVAQIVGSDRLAVFSYSPPGASADDNLLIRANKNPNTRGLQALGVDNNGLDKLAGAVAMDELKTLIVLRADLVRALGEQEFVKRFGRLDYLIVLDTDLNETCQMANQVLPIAAYSELDGSFTNFKGRVQRLSKAFDPPGGSLPAFQVIAARLADAMTGGESPSEAEKVFAAMAANEPGFRGLAFAQLGPHGAPLPD
jgi:predicted molibdopterin-dependent oxidoreductase YjgC